MRWQALCTLLASALFVAGSAKADVILPPVWPSRIIFVTSGTYTATDTDIGWYNTQVTNAAAQSPSLNALGDDWYVVGSTASINAHHNIWKGSGFWWEDTTPIYNTHGVKVADNLDDIFDGSLDAAVRWDEYAHEPVEGGARLVWSGSDLYGVKTIYPLGGGGEFTQVTLGWNHMEDPWWIDSGFLGPAASLYPLYGINPEPATVWLLGFGGLALLRRTRRRLHS